MRNLRKEKKTEKLLWIDAIALLVLIGFAVGYCHIITHSVNVGDESFHMALAHRYYLGDSPITDEWHLAQLCGVILYIPFWAFYSLTRSTDGVVLFYRVIYLICQLAVTAYTYVSLRIYWDRTCARRGDRKIFAAGALLACSVFTCYIPVCIPSLNYYSMSLMGLTVLAVTLSCYPAGKIRSVFCGVVFVNIVLAEPASIILYAALMFFSFAAMIIRRRTEKPKAQKLFSGRLLLYFNLGCFLIAIPFACTLLLRCGWRSLLEGLPHLFDGVEYVFTGSGSNIIDITLYQKAFGLYGTWTFIALAVITVIALPLHKFRLYTRPVIAAATSVVLIFAYVNAWRVTDALGSAKSAALFHGIPLYLSGPIWMLLADKADKRFCQAWFTCLLFSVLFSLSSAESVGWGGAAAAVFSVALAFQVIIECCRDTSQNIKKTAAKALSFVAAAIVAVAVLIPAVAEGQWFYKQNNFFFVENEFLSYSSRGELDCRIPDGPLKGIYTTESIAVLYQMMQNDLAEIRNVTPKEGNVFIASIAPWHYLSVDRGYGTFSTWYLIIEYDRLFRYWEEHPEKIPDYVYIPYYNTYTYKRMDQNTIIACEKELNKAFSYDIIDGQAGIILRVTDTKLFPRITG